MKWIFCKDHRIIIKNRPKDLRRHSGCKLREACDESFLHCIYRPELVFDWMRLKVEDFWSRHQSKS